MFEIAVNLTKSQWYL